MTDAFMPQVRPKTWNSGRHPMITSPGPAVNSVVVATSAFVYRFAWVSSAPFGTPVVPDVYRMTASSSSARSAQSVTGCRSPSSVRASGSVTRMTWAPLSAAPLAASSAIGPRRR